MNAGRINYCFASRASSVEPFLGNGPFNSVPSSNPYGSHIKSPTEYILLQMPALAQDV